MQNPAIEVKVLDWKAAKVAQRVMDKLMDFKGDIEEVSLLCSLLTQCGAVVKEQNTEEVYLSQTVDDLSKYNISKIVQGIRDTAWKKRTDGNSLRVAKDLPCLNSDDRFVLDSFLCNHHHAYSIKNLERLHGIANKIEVAERLGELK